MEAALCGVLAGWLAAGPAFARQPALHLLPRALPSANTPSLTVLVVPLDAAATAQVARLTYLAEQAVDTVGRFARVRMVDALDGPGARSREAKAEEAATAFQLGQKAYDELDTQKALEQFEKAAEAYAEADLSRHFARRSRAQVMKIASYVANGNNKEAARTMQEVLARNPWAEFSSNYFPPDELALVEKTRKAVLEQADKTLEVTTSPVPAQVFVDGRFEGISPVKISGLSRADHFVTVIAPGHVLAQERVSGEEARFTLTPLPVAPRLESLVESIAEEPEGEERDEALQKLGRLAGTQQVLALLVRAAPGAVPQDAIALRLDTSDGHNLGYAMGPVPASGEAMEGAIQSLLSRVLGADAPRVDGPVHHFSASQPSPERRTAGYVLLVTGAALVAGGIYLGTEASSRSSRFKELPQTDPRAGRLRSEGKRFALLADLGVLAGLGSAGAGTWLAFWGGGGGSQKQEASPSHPEPPPAPAPPKEAPTDEDDLRNH